MCFSARDAVPADFAEVFRGLEDVTSTYKVVLRGGAELVVQPVVTTSQRVFLCVAHNRPIEFVRCGRCKSQLSGKVPSSSHTKLTDK